jgi:hypothetical protein
MKSNFETSGSHHVGTTNSRAELRGELLAAKFQIARRFRRNFPEGERPACRPGVAGLPGGPLYGSAKWRGRGLTRVVVCGAVDRKW